MNYLPYRHTAKSVNRFIPTLENLITNHRTIGEHKVELDPNSLGLSTETTIARLRDAVQALKQRLVVDPRINPDYLASIWPLYRIDTEGDMVVIKPVTMVARERTFFHSTRSVLAELDTNQPNFAETLSELASLLSKRVFQGEVTINGDLPSDLQKTLEAQYDIAITPSGPNQHTML